MSNLGTMGVILTAKTGAFNAQMGTASTAVSTFGKASTVATAAAAKLALILGPIISVGVLTTFTKKSMGAIDVTAKLADRLQTTTEGLVGLQHAANLAGVGHEMFNKSMEIFVRRLGEAKGGTGELATAAERLGLNVDALSKMDPSEAFLQLSDTIKEMPTAAEKAAAAYQLFGRAGIQLVNTLDQGSEALRAQMAEAEKLGMTYSRVDAAKVEQANDAMTRLQGVGTAIFNQFAIQLAPIIEALATKFMELATQGEGLGTNLKTMFKGVAYGVAGLMMPVWALATAIMAIGYAFAEVLVMALKAIKGIIQHLENLMNKVANSWLGGKLGLKPVNWVKELKLDTILKAAENTRDATKIALADIASKNPISELGKWFEDLEAKSAAARREMEAAAKARAAMEEAKTKAETFASAIEEVDKMNEALQEQIDLFGLSEEQAKFMKLVREGEKVSLEYRDAFNKELAKTIVLQDKLNELNKKQKDIEEEKKQQDDLRKFLTKELEQLETPWEKYEDYKAKIEEALDQQMISNEKAMELLKNKWDEMFGGEEAERQGQIRSFVERELERLKTPLERFKEYRNQVIEAYNEGLIAESEKAELLKSKWDEIFEKKEQADPGQFQSVRTSLIDLAGLSIGYENEVDPIVEEVKTSNQILAEIEEGIRQMSNMESLT